MLNFGHVPVESFKPSVPGRNGTRFNLFQTSHIEEEQFLPRKFFFVGFPTQIDFKFLLNDMICNPQTGRRAIAW
jgi:hypothetical protein